MRRANGLPLVSIVLPVRDGEAYLRAAIDSILAQTFADFELIIVNDGSADSTADIIKVYAERDARLVVRHQANRGMVPTLKIACDLARGTYLARMDADDVALPCRLEQQVAFLETHPETVLLGSAVDLIDGAGRVVGQFCHPESDSAIRACLATHNCLVHPSVMMRTTAYHAVGGYREAFAHAEDYDLWLRMAEVGQIANLSHSTLLYRLHPGQASQTHIREQALWALAAQLSAKARARGDVDPIQQAGRADAALLLSLGVSASTIDRAIVDAQLSWATLMKRIGRDAAAADLLDHALRASVSASLDRERHSNLCKERALLHLRQHEPLRAARQALRAIVLRPGVILGAARYLWRRQLATARRLDPRLGR